MKTLNSISTAPGALPLFGHTLRLLRDPQRFFASLPRHGDLVRIRIGPTSALVVCDAGLTHQFLCDDRVFDKYGHLYDRGREVAGNGLVTCLHDDHRRQRRMLQPAFHFSRMPGYARTMVTQIDEVTSQWRDGQVLDVPTETGAIAARALVATMFSSALPAVALDQAVSDVYAIFSGMFWRMLTPPPLDRLHTPGNRRYNRAHARLRQTLDTLIAERRSSGADHGDLVSSLLAARDPDGDGLSDAEVADQVMTFFIAGTESSAATLSWALHLLGDHPGIADRLHAEVDAVVGGRTAVYDDLPQLDLTRRVIAETLRLKPVGWNLSRVATADTRLGGHLVQAGTTVIYSPYIIHHRADLHHDPERFDPDRWMPDREQPARDAYIPFGGGARKCIGNAFGLMEATLALATVAARWQLEPVPGRRVRSAVAVTLRPRRLRMRAIARCSPHSAARDAPAPGGRGEPAP